MSKSAAIRDALIEADRERWQCATCTAPALENSKYCFSCKDYWEDAHNGLFADKGR